MPLPRTKIIATLGPASRSEPVLRALIAAGADALRLNFSYGTWDEHARVVELIRRLSREAGRPVAIVQDLQGRKIRIGGLAGPLQLSAGAEVTLTGEAASGDASRIPVSYPSLHREVKPGDRILLGDGEVELRVEGAEAGAVRASVVVGGTVKANQGVSLPGVPLAAEAVTEKDAADLRFGLSLGVDYVALSFVRDGADVRLLKGLIAAEGASTPVIAKLEKREAVQNLEEVLDAADGVMVARGDLGLELPLEEVPMLQKRIIRRANERGVLVITATQMLESMVEQPRPTRAEVSDVANAILDGTDAVMLSAETAVGRYPAQAVGMMARIAIETEQEMAYRHREERPPDHAHAMSRAACELAQDLDAAAVVVFTRSGYSAHLVSKERPSVPVFAFTREEAVYRRLALWWGVNPLLADLPSSAAGMLSLADRYLTERGLLSPGDAVVVARWSALPSRGWTNFIQVRRLSR